MANLSFIRGGTPVVNFVWDHKTVPQYTAPFSNNNIVDTPPYDSHADGAYNLGSFVLGMPINPNNVGMTWQRKILGDKPLQVGDIVQCMYLPEDHYATALNFKSVGVDEKLAGATIALVTQTLQYAADGSVVVTEDSALDDAVTAQVGSNVFNVNEPFNAFVSLSKVEDGYAVPLYSTPSLPAKDAASQPTFGKYYIFGFKVLSLPTDPTVSLADMRKGIYMSLRCEAFECPTNY